MMMNSTRFTSVAIGYFIASIGGVTLQAAPSFDCKKAVTDVDKAICVDDNIALMDSVLDSIYKAALSVAPNPSELRKSQLQWMSKRTSNKETLEKAYRLRIQELLSHPIYFNTVVKTFFHHYDDAIKTWTRTNKLYDGMENTLIGTLMTCILDAYLKKQGMKDPLTDPENFRDRQSSSLYKLHPETYLFFYCQAMAAYNGEYTAWIISLKDSKFTATPLKIPVYDVKTKALRVEDFISGFVAFNEKDQRLQTHYKGVGYGGFATDRFFRIINDHLILVKQSATKDNTDNAYTLKGTDEDWIVEYENPQKGKQGKHEATM